jgi:PPOX class probable F420-dependent enzyme
MAVSDEQYIRVTTFKKDGTEVSTPTWVVALDDGKIGFHTSSTSGKAKRLKNNPNVIVQPSNGRGRAKPGTSPRKALRWSSAVPNVTSSTTRWSPSTVS